MLLFRRVAVRHRAVLACFQVEPVETRTHRARPCPRAPSNGCPPGSRGSRRRSRCSSDAANGRRSRAARLAPRRPTDCRCVPRPTASRCAPRLSAAASRTRRMPRAPDRARRDRRHPRAVCAPRGRRHARCSRPRAPRRPARPATTSRCRRARRRSPRTRRVSAAASTACRARCEGGSGRRCASLPRRRGRCHAAAISPFSRRDALDLVPVRDSHTTPFGGFTWVNLPPVLTRSSR